jgi:hypothetical protein
MPFHVKMQTERRIAMNTIRMTILAAAAAIAFAAAADTKTVWRDSSGRVLGTATTDRYGKTTYRDSMGRTQGTSSTDSYGKTTYRDAMGRLHGSRTVR